MLGRFKGVSGILEISDNFGGFSGADVYKRFIKAFQEISEESQQDLVRF